MSDSFKWVSHYNQHYIFNEILVEWKIDNWWRTGHELFSLSITYYCDGSEELILALVEPLLALLVFKDDCGCAETTFGDGYQTLCMQWMKKTLTVKAYWIWLIGTEHLHMAQTLVGQYVDRPGMVAAHRRHHHYPMVDRAARTFVVTKLLVLMDYWWWTDRLKYKLSN